MPSKTKKQAEKHLALRGKLQIGVSAGGDIPIYRSMNSLIGEANKLRHYYGHDGVDVMGPDPDRYFDPDLLDRYGVKNNHLEVLLAHCRSIGIEPDLGEGLQVSDTPICVADALTGVRWVVRWPQAQMMASGLGLESLNDWTRQRIDAAGGPTKARQVIMTRIMESRTYEACVGCGLRKICLGPATPQAKEFEGKLTPYTNVKLDFEDALYYEPES